MVHAMAEIENKTFLTIGRAKKQPRKKAVRRAKKSKSSHVKEKDNDRLNLVIPLELKQWAKEYVDRKNTTLTQLIIDHLVELREKEKGIDVPQI